MQDRPTYLWPFLAVAALAHREEDKVQEGPKQVPLEAHLTGSEEGRWKARPSAELQLSTEAAERSPALDRSLAGKGWGPGAVPRSGGLDETRLEMAARAREVLAGGVEGPAREGPASRQGH